jgi:hypothetical protein
MVYDMPAWDDKQINRFTFRVGLFVRRGIALLQAQSIADHLAFRDFEKDDRRMCLECSSLQRCGKCFEVQQGNIPGVSLKHEPVQTILQRCTFFAWQKP